MKAVLFEFSLVFVAIHDDVDASSAVGSRLRPTWQSGQGGSCQARQLRAQSCAQVLQFRISCIHKHTFSHVVPLSEYGLLMFVDLLSLSY